MILQKAKGAFSAVLALLVGMSFTDFSPVQTEAAFELTASEVVADMGFGWNLGNTLDACPNTGTLNVGSILSETSWGNPKTTQTLIDGVKESGVDSIRVPVTWYNHMDPETYEIDDAWMDRVEEVVNYVLTDDMYCILNMHHDTGENGWLKASSNELDTKKEILTAIWEQVSERFVDYGDKLLFEGFNEILDDNSEWVNPSLGSLDIVNDLNQLFVDTVRASGGNNAQRCLIVNTYAAAGNSYITSNFELPKDTASDKLIAECHVYQPFYFTSEHYPNDTTWENNKNYLDEQLNAIYNNFVQKGIPAIIGEFGCANTKNNMDEIISWAKYYVETCTDYGIPCFYWDNGLQYKLYNRTTGNVTEMNLLGTMLAASQGSTYVPDTTVQGDVNDDGVFNTADAVMLQKWLLGSGSLTNWKAGDVCTDSRINALDLCMVRKMLLQQDNLCSDIDNWSSWVDTSGSAEAEIQYTNNGVVASVKNGGTNTWDVQVSYKNIALEQGATYKISFDYSSTASHTMDCHVMQNYGDYTPYHSIQLDYTTDVQHYEGTFTMHSATDTNVQMAFNCGGSNLEPCTVTISDLSLIKISDAADVDVSGETDQDNDSNQDSDSTSEIDYGTPINTNANMVADLRNGSSSYFFPSGPWTNGGVFDCGWTSSNIIFDDVMNITITDDPSSQYNYLSGEYRTYQKYGYGYYECSMMPIKANGVDTGFFMYTGPSDGDPWDEIDFEFLGYDTTKVQLNYYTDGVGGHEYMLDLGFDASEGYHTYGFDWQEDSITWYVDGVERYRATENIPTNPGRIMVNAWPGIGVDEWLKPFEGNVPLTAKFQWITWSASRD